MNDHDRGILKERLRILDQDRGIRFDTPQHWVIDGIKRPEPFFRQLSWLMDSSSVLYLEGTAIHPEAGSFYLRHASAHSTAVACDTIFPVPDVYHVDWSPDAVVGMLELISRRPIKELFDHVKGYRDGRVVFTLHDAFEGSLRVADSIPEAKLAAFCSALQVPYRRERTAPVKADALRGLLNAMENPDKVRMPHDPWWRRIAAEFMAGFREK